jgi:hypothetical protein
MTAGATQAPATASAISFLFIRISFVEVRPDSLEALGNRLGNIAPILGTYPKSF